VQNGSIKFFTKDLYFHAMNMVSDLHHEYRSIVDLQPGGNMIDLMYFALDEKAADKGMNEHRYHYTFPFDNE